MAEKRFNIFCAKRTATARDRINENLSITAGEVESRLSTGGFSGGKGRAEWALTFAVIGGAPFSFDRHEYLRGIYECGSPHIVLEKAAQMGGSVFGIVDSL